MEAQVKYLENGIPVVLIPMPGRKTFTHLCVVRGGSRYELKMLNGISHFVEHMLFKGTKKRPSAEEIATELEGLGATNNAYTSEEVIGFWVRASARHFSSIADILADQLLNPLFRKEDINLEKGPGKEEMSMRLSDPSVLVWDTLTPLIYGDQPAGWNVIGTEDVINRLNRDHLFWFRQRHFHSKNIVLGVAGRFPAEDKVLEILNQNYGELRSGTVPLFYSVVSTGQAIPRVALVERDIPQTSILLSLQCPDSASEQVPALSVLKTILGSGMSSRLFTEVRERRGLVYDIWAYSNLSSDTGQFVIGAGATGDKVFEALGIVRDELKKIATEPVLEAELKKVKNMIEGGMHRAFENPQELLTQSSQRLLLFGHIKPISERLARIKAVTAKDVLELAQTIVKNEYLNLAVVGPHADVSREHFLEVITF